MKARGSRVDFSARFKRDLRKVDPRIANAAIEAVERLTRDRDHPSLNFEKIGKKVWSIRVTRNFRILLERQTDKSGEIFVAFRLGTHDIYKHRR